MASCESNNTGDQVNIETTQYEKRDNNSSDKLRLKSIKERYSDSTDQTKWCFSVPVVLSRDNSKNYIFYMTNICNTKIIGTIRFAGTDSPLNFYCESNSNCSRSINKKDWWDDGKSGILLDAKSVDWSDSDKPPVTLEEIHLVNLYNGRGDELYAGKAPKVEPRLADLPPPVEFKVPEKSQSNRAASNPDSIIELLAFGAAAAAVAAGGGDSDDFAALAQGYTERSKQSSTNDTPNNSNRSINFNRNSTTFNSNGNYNSNYKASGEINTGEHIAITSEVTAGREFIGVTGEECLKFGSETLTNTCDYNIKVLYCFPDSYTNRFGRVEKPNCNSEYRNGYFFSGFTVEPGKPHDTRFWSHRRFDHASCVLVPSLVIKTEPSGEYRCTNVGGE